MWQVLWSQWGMNQYLVLTLFLSSRIGTNLTECSIKCTQICISVNTAKITWKRKKTMLIIQVTMWPYKTTEEKTHSNKSALGEPFKLQAFKYYTWVQYEIKLKAAGCLIQHRLPLVCHKNMLWLYNILGIAHMVNSAYEDGSQCKSFELMLMKCCLNSKHSYAKWNETLTFPSPPPF